MGTGEIRFNGDRREDHTTAKNLRILDDRGIVSLSQLDISGFTTDRAAAQGDDIPCGICLGWAQSR